MQKRRFLFLLLSLLLKSEKKLRYLDVDAVSTYKKENSLTGYFSWSNYQILGGQVMVYMRSFT